MRAQEDEYQQIEDESLEAMLYEYSEIETIPKNKFEVPLPKTIQRYQEKIRANNTTSIFDQDYNYSEDLSSRNSTDSSGVLKDEGVTFVVSGRGRGGGNYIIKPNELQKQVNNGDFEIKQQLRKVNPIGYSNEITENAVRAHRLAKEMENISPNGTKPNSPAPSKTGTPLPSKTGTPTPSKTSSPAFSSSTNTVLSKTSSPAISEVSSPSKSKSTMEIDSPSSSKMNLKLDMESSYSSGKSTSTSSSEVHNSSDYFTTQDHYSSPSSSDTKPISDRNEVTHLEIDNDTMGTQKGPDASKDAVSKPLPLSVLLKKSREDHQRRKLPLQNATNNIPNNDHHHENDWASQRKIQEILRQDRLEEERTRKLLEKSTSSRQKQSQPKKEVLPWRQRNNSPPRAWHIPNCSSDKSLSVMTQNGCETANLGKKSSSEEVMS